MIKVIDNAFPEKIAQELDQVYIDNTLQYYFTPATVDPNISEQKIEHTNLVDTPQFVHYILRDNGPESPIWETVRSMLYFTEETFDIEIQGLRRIKINVLLPDPRSSVNNFHYPHTDIAHNEVHVAPDVKWYSMIYYINNADGDTVLFEAKQNQYLDCDNIVQRVSPKRNRLLLFESDRFHTSSSPSENFRSVINFVFYGKEKKPSEWKKTFTK